MKEPKMTDDDDGDTLEEEEEGIEPKLSDDDDGDTPEIEPLNATSLGYKECCDDPDESDESEKYAEQSGWDKPSFQVTNDNVREDWESKFNVPDDSVSISKQERESKDKINDKIMKLIMYRSERKWFATIAVISIFGALLILMLSFIAMGKDLMPEWKEILLVMLGAFVGSFSRVIDHYFNNSQAEEKLLESAND